MHVVGHNDVTADRPTMADAGSAPFIGENCSNGCRRENATSMERARCDKINRINDPNPVEAPEVTMHASIVAGIADPGLCQIVVYSGAGITDPGYN